MDELGPQGPGLARLTRHRTTTSYGDMMTSKTETACGHRTKLDLWKVAAIALILLALITRLYALGDRAVSHDETTHAKYSWNLYSGGGFRHDPLMHGPLLFEATAFFFALFGVSDFTARLYSALAGVALVAAPWLLRRWMGRLGALLASVMVLVSPTITYYSRYARHDIPMLLFITLLLWSILQYLDRDPGDSRWLMWMSVLFALVFATKENAYMYTALFLALMALPLIWQLFTVRWAHSSMVRLVVALLALALVLGGAFVLAYSSAPVTDEGLSNNEISAVAVPVLGRLALGGAVLSVAGALVGLVHGIGEAQIRQLRLFDVLLVLGTFTLPLGSALLMSLIAGVDMNLFYQALMSADFSDVPLPSLVGAFSTLIMAVGVSVAVGLWWDRRRWPLLALAYYGVFFVLYSTLFTYGWGVLSGLAGGLAYWISQQGIQRGSQPWYYYGMIGSLYEYLPLLASSAGIVWIAVRGLRQLLLRGRSRTETAGGARVAPTAITVLLPRLWPLFLVGWAVLSWGAYIVAGEKMPWLFVHIAYPHILLAAWFLGNVFDVSALRRMFHGSGWLVPVSLVFGALAWGAFRQSSGALQQLFQQGLGAESLELAIAQLQPLGKVIGGLTGLLLFSGLLFSAVTSVGLRRSLRLSALTVVAILGGLTVRTMVMAAFINDELATEYIVYAHGTPDVKEVLDQVEEISWRLTGTPDQIQVAYGKETAWPFYWYMYTQFPNNYYFDTPEAERLLASPVIIAARSEWESVEAITGADYDSYDYRHVWWPVEDYKNLTWEQIRRILTEPERRKAIWDIVWKRDYARYAKLRNPDDPFTLVTWPHRVEFRFYVRRSLAEEIWAYQVEAGEIQVADGGGVTVAGESVASDVPLQAYEQPAVAMAKVVLDGASPRGLAVAPDGSVYVADPAGHLIWHMTLAGDVVDVWGSHGAAPGQFNEPADVAVDAAGNVYVADTWNHRVQKFAPDTVGFAGEPLASWGRFAKVTANEAAGWGAFYGPRGIDIGPDGNVYVTDTGNNRVQVFDAQGQFLRVFGVAGDRDGQLREPVGIAVGANGEVFIADTWHRRIQVFNSDGFFARAWDVPPWSSLRLDDRPQLAVIGDLVVATDPVYQRILVYDSSGELQQVMRDSTTPPVPGGVDVTAAGVVVSDRVLSQLLIYSFEGVSVSP